MPIVGLRHCGTRFENVTCDSLAIHRRGDHKWPVVFTNSQPPIDTILIYVLYLFAYDSTQARSTCVIIDCRWFSGQVHRGSLSTWLSGNPGHPSSPWS